MHSAMPPNYELFPSTYCLFSAQLTAGKAVGPPLTAVYDKPKHYRHAPRPGLHGLTVPQTIYLFLITPQALASGLILVRSGLLDGVALRRPMASLRPLRPSARTPMPSGPRTLACGLVFCCRRLGGGRRLQSLE